MKLSTFIWACFLFSIAFNLPILFGWPALIVSFACIGAWLDLDANA